MEHTRADKPGRTLALACGLLGTWGWILLGPLYLETLRPPAGKVTDFYQDWGSVRNHQVGLPIYTPHSVSIPRHLGLPNNPNESIEYNAHPPGMVLLTLPLGWFNYREAFLIWDLGSLATFIASLAIVAAVLPAPRSWFWPVWACLPFCQPLFADIQLGQLTLFLLLLTTAAWALQRSGREVAAGILLGIATSVKLFPAYLLVYFLFQRRIRVCVAAAAAFTAWNALAVLTLGLNAYYDYIQVVLPRMESFRAFAYNLSLTGFWHKLFHPVGERGWVPPLWSSPSLAQFGSLSSVAAVTAVVALLSYRARTLSQRDLAFSAAMIGMLLASPVTWVYSLLLLLVPLAVLAHGAGRPGWFAPQTLALVAAFLATPQEIWTTLVAGQGPIIVTPLFVLGAASIKLYALIALFVMVSITVLQDQNTNGAISERGPLTRAKPPRWQAGLGFQPTPGYNKR